MRAASHVYFASKAFVSFEKVFGRNSDRLVKVLAGQAVNEYLNTLILDAVDNPTFNPSNVRPDVFATAPYFGDYQDDGRDENILAKLRVKMEASIATQRSMKTLIESRGLKLVGYEGGHHVTTNGGSVVANPGIRQLYVDYYRQLDDIFGTFCHYNHVKSWQNSGFGVKSYIGQPDSECPAWQGLADYIGVGTEPEEPADCDEIHEDTKWLDYPTAFKLLAPRGTVVDIFRVDPDGMEIQVAANLEVRWTPFWFHDDAPSLVHGENYLYCVVYATPGDNKNQRSFRDLAWEWNGTPTTALQLDHLKAGDFIKVTRTNPNGTTQILESRLELLWNDYWYIDTRELQHGEYYDYVVEKL